MAKGKTQDGDNDPNDKEKRSVVSTKTAPWVWCTLATFVIITYVTMPVPLQPPHGQAPSIQHVFYYGWLTAIFTGLGAVPLAFAPNLASYWVGLSNGTYRHPTEKVALLFRCLLSLVCFFFGLGRVLYCPMKRFDLCMHRND